MFVHSSPTITKIILIQFNMTNDNSTRPSNRCNSRGPSISRARVSVDFQTPIQITRSNTRPKMFNKRKVPCSCSRNEWVLRINSSRKLDLKFLGDLNTSSSNSDMFPNHRGSNLKRQKTVATGTIEKHLSLTMMTTNPNREDKGLCSNNSYLNTIQWRRSCPNAISTYSSHRRWIWIK